MSLLDEYKARQTNSSSLLSEYRARKSTTATTTSSAKPSTPIRNAHDAVFKVGRPNVVQLHDDAPNSAAKNLGDTFFNSLAGIAPKLSDAVTTMLAKKLANRDRVFSDVKPKDLITNWKEDTKNNVSFGQRLVNSLGTAIDVSENAAKTIPPIAVLDKWTDELASYILNKQGEKEGKTPDEVAKEFINKLYSIGDENDKTAQRLAEERQNYSGGVQTAGNVIGAIGNMLPAVGASVISKKPNIGLSMLSAAAGGQKGQQVYEEIGDANKAYTAAALEAGKEYATERAFGGVLGLGKGAVPAVIGKPLSKSAKAAIEGFKATGTGKLLSRLGNIGGEMGEETISQYLESYIDRTYDPDAARATKQELWEAAKTGGIVSLILGGGSSVLPKLQTKPQVEQTPKVEQPIPQVGQKQAVVPSQPIQSNLNNTFAIPEGGKQVPSEFGTKNLQKSAELGTVSEDIASKFKDASHYQVGQQESIDAASKIVFESETSPEETRLYLENKIKNKQALNSTETTAGLVLIQHYSKLGSVGEQQAISIADNMIQAATEAGRVLQIYRTMQQNLPGGLMRVTEGIINNRLNNNIKTDTLTEVDINDIKVLEEIMQSGEIELSGENYQNISNDMRKWLLKLKQYADKGTVNVSDAAMGKALSIVESKRKTSGREKIRGMQRIALLSNPKTHVRNIGGNLLLGMGETAASPIASAVDKLYSLATKQSTYSGMGIHKEQFKGLVDGLNKAIQDYRLGLESGDKYTETFGKSDKQKSLENSIKGTRRNAFNEKGLGKVANATDRLIGFILDLGDAPFMMAQYQNALADLVKANPQAVLENGGKPTAEMIETATESALRRTFKDDNAVTEALQAIRNASGTIGDVIAPFVKTPSNVVKMGVEYTPFGWMEAAKKTFVGKNSLRAKISRGESTMSLQRDIAELWGRGAVGSALILAGMVAKAAGKATGDKEEKEKQRNWNIAKGIANNSILINGKYYDISSLPPLAVPILAGAAMNGDISWEEFAGAIGKVGNSVTEMPVLQGIQDVLSGGFQDQSIPEIGAKLGGNLLGQVIPGISLSRQIANATDQYQRDTSSDKEGVSKVAEKSLNYLKTAIPGLRETLPIKYDVLGNPRANYPAESAAGRLANIFLNPANVSVPISTPVTEEIDNLYQQTQNTEVLPKSSPNNFSNKGISYDLTVQEKQNYQKAEGQTLNSLMSDLIKTDAYKSATSAEKVNMIKKIQDYASDKAKGDILDNRNVTYEGDSFTQKLEKLKKTGIPASSVIVVGSTSGENEEVNGQKVQASGSARRALAISKMDLTPTQAYMLADSFDVSNAVKDAMVIGMKYSADMDRLMNAVIKIENTTKIGTLKKHEAQAIVLSQQTLADNPKIDKALKKLLSDAIITKDFGGSKPTNYNYSDFDSLINSF